MSKFSVAGVKPPTIDDSQSEPSFNNHSVRLELKKHCVKEDEDPTIDVPTSYLCPVSPMYSSDSESETNYDYIKCKYIAPMYSDSESENKTTISTARVTGGLVPKIENLLIKHERLSIGKGGYGKVYAYYLDNARVAIKIFDPKVKEVEIKKEVEILQHLSSACIGIIPNYFGHGVNEIKSKKTFWICMDIVQGEVLHKLKHNFELNRFVSVFVKTLRALQSIHEAGIVHGDIKEDNTLFTDKEVKIIDFGSSESFVTESYNKGGFDYKGVTYLGK